MTIADYNEVFSILVKYTPRSVYAPDKGPEAVYPFHEEIRIFIDPEIVSEEDKQILEDRYGVHPAPEKNPPHFYIFT